jgi:hypothetical protein
VEPAGTFDEPVERRPAPVTAGHEASEGDAADLARFGYEQKQHRRLNLFSTFAAGSSYMSKTTWIFERRSEDQIAERVSRQVPLRRQGTAEEVASAVGFLAPPMPPTSLATRWSSTEA